MYLVKEQPLMWAGELTLRVGTITVLQICVGLAAVLISRIRTTLPRRYFLLSVVLVANCWFSLAASDLQSCLQSVIVAGLTSGFITPLRAFAHVFRSAIDNDYATTDPFSAIIRIAVPAVDASPVFQLKQQRIPSGVERRDNKLNGKISAGESPSKQITRGIVLLTISSTSKYLWPTFRARGGIAFDAFAAVTVWSSTSGVLNLTSAARAVLLGESSGAPFSAPFIAPSQVAFWSYRWNAPVSEALRGAVYEPFSYLGFSRSFSAMACFFVSGLGHELILRFVEVRESRGEWFLFFILAGFATLIEKRIPFSRVCPVLRRFSGILTIGFLFRTLFVPCTMRSGFAQRAVSDLAAGPEFLLALYQRIVK